VQERQQISTRGGAGQATTQACLRRGLSRVGFVESLNQAQTFFQTGNPVAFVQTLLGRDDGFCDDVHGGCGDGRYKPEMGVIIEHKRSLIAQISKISRKSQTFRSKFKPFKSFGRFFYGFSTPSRATTALF
jgi:hypothetical protein